MSVYRVNWLRSKAQLARWKEEKELCRKELKWTMEYYRRQASLWLARDASASRGHQAYAARQAAMWVAMAEHAAKEGAKLRM